MDGFYHQDERDMAAGVGCVVLIIGVMFITVVLGVAIYLSSRQPEKQDGSTAGANAVTREELESLDGEVI